MSQNQKTPKGLIAALIGSGLLIGFLLFQIFSPKELLPVIPQVPGSINIWIIFLTGLTVGGLTCLAVQGGLLASVITAREEEVSTNKKTHALISTTVFLLAKLTAYTLLGFVLGAFGGVINISGTVQTVMQMAAGLYMIAVALNLLNIHPIFRYVIIQPPRFLTRLVRNQSRSKDVFAPALLGAMTIFIPCGTTLAMEALAISSANALMGAAIMDAFILGTIPVFFGIGFMTSLLGDTFRSKFLKLAALAVFYLGFMSVNGSLVAFGSPITMQSVLAHIPVTVNFNDSGNQAQNDTLPTIQNPEIDITSAGYTPDYIRVKQGQEVTLTLKSKDAYSCASAFRIPSLGIARNLHPNETQVITFTPTEKGQIQFNCTMGMYRGVIEVL
ncbi:MAG: sulfite exporter TauE/SafE family protein [Candidatus Levyibacteriota bacterium]